MTEGFSVKRFFEELVILFLIEDSDISDLSTRMLMSFGKSNVLSHHD